MYKIVRLTLAMASLAVASFAGVVGVTSPAGLGANSSLDWGQLGPDFTAVPGPLTATSLLGDQVTVSNGTNEFWSIQEGNSWSGNFNPGDNLLFNQAGGPVTLVFLTPIKAIGARFQSLDFGAFTIFITAFDASHTSLGTASTSGTSNAAADGSAAFLGVLSSSADIASVSINVQVSGSDDPFAFGPLSTAEAAASSVPEPSTILLTIGGVLVGVVRRYHRQRA
jgi:hypothetical protein